MNIFVKNAKYIGDFKFDIEFNNDQKIVDIRKIRELDKRYDEFELFQPLKNEEFVKHLQPNGITISYKDIDIAPELLYQASIEEK